MNTLRKAVLGALMAASVAGVYAASPPPPSDGAPPPAHGAWGHGREHHRVELLMHALKQVNITEQQKQSVHGILQSAKPQFEALMGQIRDNERALATLGPDDPNYAATLATAKTLAANMVQQRSDVRVQIYGVLTPKQKAELPQVFADMKAKADQRRQQWQQQHPQGGPAAEPNS